MTVAEAVANLAARFEAAGVPTPRVDAELLVAHVLGCRPARLRSQRDMAVPATAVHRLEQLGGRRAAREPLQLLVGSVGFRHLDIQVRHGVFIPRPETEVLAGLAVERTPAGGVVVEPCTGTGAVACCVATEASPAVVIATDLSEAAVDLARANADRAQADVTVLHGDLLDPLPDALRGGVDVVVANPPYVAAGEMAGLEPELGWDPIEALVSGPTGQEVVQRLIEDAADWLRPGGSLLLEVDSTRARATAELLRDHGYRDVFVAADLTGRERIAGGRASSR